MKLEINNPTQQEQLVSAIEFTDHHVILQGETPIVLNYKETSFRLVLHLHVRATSPSAGTQLDEIFYSPAIAFIVLEFITPDFTYQVHHMGSLQLCFDLLGKKFPFKDIFFGFTGNKNDKLTRQLAQRITKAFTDYMQYGRHDPIVDPCATHIGGKSSPHFIYYGMDDDPALFTTRNILMAVVFAAGIILPSWLLHYLYTNWDGSGLVWGFAVAAGVILLVNIFYLGRFQKSIKNHLKLRQLRKQISTAEIKNIPDGNPRG